MKRKRVFRAKIDTTIDPKWFLKIALRAVPCHRFMVPGAIHTRMWKGLKSVFLSYQSSASARLRKATTR
jgi:hypothetical protein